EATYEAMVKAKSFEDEDLRVRLAALLSLTDMPKVSSMGELLVDIAGREENITDTWVRHALIIASKLNGDLFQEAFRNRGMDNNPPLIDASLPQRLAYGSRLNTVQLRRTFGRQQSEEAPEVAGKEILISGEIERSNRFNAPGQAPSPISGIVVAQGNKSNGYGIYMLDGKLYYNVNQNGKSYQLVTSDPLSAKFSFKAGLQKDGAMRLFIDDKEIGTT